MADSLLDLALEAKSLGLSVVPPRQNGSKAPLGEWKQFQDVVADEETIRGWYSQGLTGLGLVCGAVSGGLEMFELEGRAVEAGLEDELWALACDLDLNKLLGRVMVGYMERTPSGGLHLLYRCPAPVTLKLASTEDGLVLIETKGEGGYTVIAPTNGKVHATGRPWVREIGELETIQTITAEEQEDLHVLARRFDRSVRKVQTGAGPNRLPRSGDRPGDRFAAVTAWPEILEPHGWVWGKTAQDGRQHLRRPGKAQGVSATISDDGQGVFYCFTSSAPPFEPNQGYSKFAAHALLNHGGDFTAAAKTLAASSSIADRDVAGHAAQLAGLRLSESDLAEATAKLLDELISVLCSFLVFGSMGQPVAIALWILHTHVFNAFETTPYLAITSPSKRSGKSRLLELLAILVARAWYVLEPTEATLFRKVDASTPTLLVDEMDATFGKDSAVTEGLRAIYNAGYRKGATVPRCVGQGHDVRDFNVFCPKAFAGIKGLPDTVADRSIPVVMKRRAPHERQPERFRLREVRERLTPLVDSIVPWATVAADILVDARPALPESLSDRAQDGWEPLLAIAELAGAGWRAQAWAAAQELNGHVEDGDVGVLLLVNCQEAFGDQERLSTTALLRHLVDRGDESPWARWWGEDLDRKPEPATKGPGSRLAKLLKPYGIESEQIRFGEINRRGYRRSSFEEAWTRYCPAPPSIDAENATTLQTTSDRDCDPSKPEPEQGSGQARSVVAFSELEERLTGAVGSGVNVGTTPGIEAPSPVDPTDDELWALIDGDDRDGLTTDG